MYKSYHYRLTYISGKNSCDLFNAVLAAISLNYLYNRYKCRGHNHEKLTAYRIYSDIARDVDNRPDRG